MCSIQHFILQILTVSDRPLVMQFACFSGFFEMLIKMFVQILKKILICEMQTKLNTKVYVIPRGPFIINFPILGPCSTSNDADGFVSWPRIKN